MSRADARARSLGLLYSAEARGADPELEGVGKRVSTYVAGVWEHRETLDASIAEVATGWRVERMPAVDRNVLRLGLYELRFTETPIGVIVSEAVELAKNYSTARSGAFVNGVLARLAELERGELGDQSTETEP